MHQAKDISQCAEHRRQIFIVVVKQVLNWPRPWRSVPEQRAQLGICTPPPNKKVQHLDEKHPTLSCILFGKLPTKKDVGISFNNNSIINVLGDCKDN